MMHFIKSRIITVQLVKNRIILVSIFALVLLELLHRLSLGGNLPEVIHLQGVVAVTLLIIVMYASFSGGRRAAAVSSFMSIAYLLFFYSTPDHLFFYTEDSIKRVAIAGSSLFLIGLIAGNLHDRTEQILERERKARRKAEISEKQKDEFMGLVSHELKTPLTSLKAFVQLLEMRFKKYGDHDTASHLGKMDTQLNKLNVLIADLYDVTKLETNKLKISKEMFSFEELVNEVVEEIQQISDKHQIIKELKVKKNVYGDRKRIGQVITNLLMNAIKFSPSSDKIVVQVKSSQGMITFSVQDFGEGVEKENQKKIFHKFFQNKNNKAGKFRGLGLGLYISSEIIRMHKGKIWVKSQKDKGSTFSFSLPAKKKAS